MNSTKFNCNRRNIYCEGGGEDIISGAADDDGCIVSDVTEGAEGVGTIFDVAGLNNVVFVFDIGGGITSGGGGGP